MTTVAHDREHQGVGIAVGSLLRGPVRVHAVVYTGGNATSDGRLGMLRALGGAGASPVCSACSVPDRRAVQWVPQLVTYRCAS